MSAPPLDIPGLPPLPPTPTSRDGHDAAWRQAWRDWRDAVLAERDDLDEECEADADAREDALALCAADPAYWLAMVGWVFEPRLKGGRGGDSPFVPYPFQIRMLRWLQARLDADGPDGDGLVSKARDMGASWTACAFVLWGWLFRHPFNALFISRKEDLVDAKDPNSLFYKVDYLLDRLPDWMRPQGFDPKLHRQKLFLQNPQNGNVLSGESTTKRSGRGARVTCAVLDEAAFIDDLNHVYAALAPSTDHRLLISSESVECGEDFLALRRGLLGAKPPVLELDWWLHPEHDEAWYAAEKARYPSLAHFAREVERNAEAGLTEKVYPDAELLEVGTFPLVPGDPVDLAIDPGKDDHTWIHFIQWSPVTGRYRLVESYYNRHQPGEFYASIMTGIPDLGPDGFAYAETDVWFLEWVRAEVAPLLRAVYGDPYGASTYAAPKTGPYREESFYDRIFRKSAELRRREHGLDGRGLIVRRGHKLEQRTYQGRRLALMRMLPRLDFNDTPNVRRALAALKSYRFDPPTKERLAEQQTPVHNWASHPTTALEYWAVHLEEKRTLEALPALEPGKRAALGGLKKERAAWQTA